MKRMSVTKRNKVTGRCRKLHNEELLYLCSSLNVVRTIKSRGLDGRGKYHAIEHEKFKQKSSPRSARKGLFGIPKHR
jgi:hypothetical protein